MVSHRDESAVRAPGTLTVKTYNAQGRQIGEHELVSAESKTLLTLCPEINVVKSGRLCYIAIRYTDDKGVVKPLSRGIVEVEVEGGTLLGLGSACPYNDIGFVSKRTDTYYGEAMAVVLAGESGSIHMAATDGTLTAEANIPIIP